MKNLHAQKIAVFRALQLGDMLCAVPALRALRSLYPFAEITLIGLPWANEFVERFKKYIDRFIPFPGYEGLPEQNIDKKTFAEFVETIKKEHYDLLIQLHGDGSITNAFINQLGAKITAGSFAQEKICPNPQTFIPYKNDVSEIERILSVVANLGTPSSNKLLEFPILSGDQNELHMSPEYISLKKKPYICIHPGARDKKRRWNAKHFSFIADYFISRGHHVVFTGIAEELPLIQTITERMKFVPINLAGKLSLGATAALLKESKLVISNCTSIAHLADALHVKSIIIYQNVDINRWAPQNQQLHKIVQDTEDDATKRVLDEAALFLERRFL